MSQYFEPRPSTPSRPGTVALEVGDVTLALATDAGVFSRGGIDAGTRVLLRKAAPPPHAGTVLDLGCGYGAIALALAAQAPDATVWGVDVNERALALVRANAVANGLGNVRAALPDDVPADVTFDAVYSNPPIRVGKGALHDLLQRWLPRLASGGQAYLVVQRHLGADSLHQWLDTVGFMTRRLASSKGYRVLEVRSR
jgi:16S rRNA G1207 methylase RsmC